MEILHGGNLARCNGAIVPFSEDPEQFDEVLIIGLTQGSLIQG
ncbi:hypothetical protein ACN4EG_15190 [Alkalinema pantanalense CENA528]